MEKRAALHETDMVPSAYLQPDPKSMGRTDVNSSIGSSQNQRGRIAAMDEAARDAIDSGIGHRKWTLNGTVPWKHEKEMRDEHFEIFVEEFGEVTTRVPASSSAINGWRSTMPSALLGYWSEEGWSGFGKGLF